MEDLANNKVHFPQQSLGIGLPDMSSSDSRNGALEPLRENKIVIVCGPTASGKSEVSLHLAKMFDGEIVGADSMQLYEGLVVGTAALRQEKLAGVKQHLVGFLKPSIKFSVADYTKVANETITDVLKSGKLPIMCGGTGQYVQAISQGIEFEAGEQNTKLVDELEKEWQECGAEQMLSKLSLVDFECAQKLHVNDKKRILKALEQFSQTGLTLEQRNEKSKKNKSNFDILCLGLYFEDRQKLYERINARVDGMMKEGLLQEAKLVYKNKNSYVTAAQAIGYKEFFGYFDEKETLEACTQKLKQATRNYAKRQLTWFKKTQGIKWVNAQNKNCLMQCEQLVSGFISGRLDEKSNR